jgi:gas vesicle protein
MHQTTSNDAGTGFALMGFVAGFIGGAVVALLYAPYIGRDTRQYLSDQAGHLREKGERFRDSAMQQGREFVEQGRSAFERGRDSVSTAVNEGREAYRQTKASEAI